MRRSPGEPLEGSYGLTAPDDDHVVAAAVVAGAGALVTSNLKHFPPDKAPAIAPARFAQDTVAVAPARAVAAVETLAGRSGRGGRPCRSVNNVLRHLEEVYAMTAAVQLMRDEVHPV